jgi:hypothetical protein
MDLAVIEISIMLTAAPMSQQTVFARALESVLQSAGLGAADVAHINRWAEDPRAEEVWQEIKTHADAHCGWLPPEYFIQNVLAQRSIAQHPDAITNYGEQASAAEALARFLNRFGELPPPAPKVLEKFPNLVESLEGAALLLREYEKVQKASRLARVSRKASTRGRSLFMLWINQLLREVCGKDLDSAAAVLTDIAFPEKETTLDQVRTARRPLSRRKRPHKVAM